MNFAETLKYLRARAGMTQKEVANEIGVTLRTYAAYENENRHPSDRSKYYALASLFNVDAEMFREDDADNRQVTIGLGELFVGCGRTRNNTEDASTYANKLINCFMKEDLAIEEMTDIMERVQRAFWDARDMKRKKEAFENGA